MAEYKFMVMSKPVAGRSDDYNDWYDNRHLDDVLQVPGLVGAQRFELLPSPTDAEPEFRHLAIYDIVSDDIEATLEHLMSRANTEHMPVSDAIDPNVKSLLYKARDPIRRAGSASAENEASPA